jgi:hypothetical protein
MSELLIILAVLVNQNLEVGVYRGIYIYIYIYNEYMYMYIGACGFALENWHLSKLKYACMCTNPPG